MKPNDNTILNVGIDLGTYRSSIVAANNQRHWVESFVGWPKDFIAEKVLGKSVLVGADALENRLSLDLHRPLQHGVIKEGINRNEEAVTELVRHLLVQCKPQPGQKIHAVVGVPADGLKVNKLAIKKALEGQVSALMVVSEPFAVAYGRDLLNNAMTIDIGAGTVDFCTMHGTVPGDADQKSILSAGDSIDEKLMSGIKSRYPDVDLTMNMVRQLKEKHSFVGTAPQNVVVELPKTGHQISCDITAAMKEACESIMPAIVDTTVQMIARFDPEFQGRIKKHMVLAGGGSRIRGIAPYLAAALRPQIGDCQLVCVEDPLYAGAEGCLKLALDMPEKYWVIK